MLNASKALTVTLKGPPAVTLAGALTVRWVAAAGVTVTGSSARPLVTGLLLLSPL